jgi:hypothetical protein
MVLAVPLILAAAAGLDRLLRALAIPGRWVGEAGTLRAGPAIWALALVAIAGWSLPTLAEPLNAPFRGYRLAADWLKTRAEQGSPVVDATGWSLFYASRPGYTFANLHLALGDPSARYVVVREAHLFGPWGYCKMLHGLVEGREPIAVFPEDVDPDDARATALVYVFDRRAAQTVAHGPFPAAHR